MEKFPKESRKDFLEEYQIKLFEESQLLMKSQK